MNLRFWERSKSSKEKPPKKAGEMKVNLLNSQLEKRPQKKVARRAPEAKLPNFEMKELNNLVRDVENSIWDTETAIYEKLYATADINIKDAQALLQRLKDARYENEDATRQQAEEITRLRHKIRDLKNEIDPINTKAIAAEKAEREKWEKERAEKLAEIRATILANQKQQKQNVSGEKQRAAKILEIRTRIETARAARVKP